MMEVLGNMRDFCMVFLFFLSISVLPRLSGRAAEDQSKSKFIKYVEVLIILLFV